MHPQDPAALADYRRQVAELYAEVRRDGADKKAWQRWREARDRIFRDHSQSAIVTDDRAAFGGLHYFDHDPRFRFEATLQPLHAEGTQIGHSGAGSTGFVAVGTISLAAIASDETLTVYWLDSYGGGLFLPFRDGTAGRETYGGGRYLLDTAKGADLGSAGEGRLIIDFNYAYHPSCVHRDEWSCPLSPPENRIAMPVTAGERLATPKRTEVPQQHQSRIRAAATW